MRNNTLYVMCGVPGSGKSTFAQGVVQLRREKREDSNSIIWVSRDEIRYSMFGGVENVTLDNYYNKENQVKASFYEIINRALMAGADVIADATHLNAASRKGLLKRIYAKHGRNIAIVMSTPLPTCLERNATREGVKHVPEEVVRRMWNSFQMPTTDEGFNEIRIVDKDGCLENIYESEG